MKNVTYCIFFLLIGNYFSVQSQMVEWDKEIIRYNHTDYSYNDLLRINSIQLANRDILIIQNNQCPLELENMPTGYRYDSLVLCRVTSAGETSWRRSYLFTGRGKIYAAAPTPDSGFVITGIQGNNMAVFRFDKNGFPVKLLQWPKPLDKFYPTNITIGPDNNYYILTAEFYFNEYVDKGYFAYNVFDVKYNMIKTDPNGNIAWIKSAGSDILNSVGAFPYPAPPDTFTIRDITLFSFLERETETIELANSRNIVHDELGDKREIYISRWDTAGNEIYRKTLIDSFYLPSHYPYTNYLDAYSLRSSLSRTGGEYIFTYNERDFTYSIDSAYTFSYYQTFDSNGNKLDSIFRQQLFDPNTEYIGKGLNAARPVFKDSSGQYLSLNFKPIGPDDQDAGKVVLNTFDSQFQLTGRAELPELTLYANLESHNLLNLYPASDGGILAVYNIIYGELDNNEAPGDGIRIAKFSNRGNSITFQCFIDRNNNGSRDGADTTFDDALIQTEHQQQTQEYPMDYFGELSINTDTGNYISKLVSYYQRIKYYAVFPPAHNHTFTSYGNRDTVTFRLVPRPDIQDLQITITPVNNARPGFNADYNIQARNIGTKTTYDILIKFLMDGRQQFSATDLDGYTKNNDTLAWSLDSLAPLEVFSFTISCLNVVPPGLDAGDTLDLLAFIFPMELDSFKADNIFLLRQPVVNSADPNDKLEAHGSGITTTQLAGREFLYYTIRFQNTGNDWAYQVIVKDTLSEQLDWSTFEMLNASDIYILEVKDKRFVTWYMYGIYLPDSTLDEPGSHGFISFRIKPKAGLTNSDVITNRASILFDFNEAIVTNTATTRILEERITLVKNKEIKSIKLYPSPTHDRFMMEFELKQKQNITLSVLNVSGQLIYCRPVSLESGKHSIPVDISGFSNGIYFIQLNTDSQNIYSGKVLKQ